MSKAVDKLPKINEKTDLPLMNQDLVRVTRDENISLEFLEEGIKKGRIVVLKNKAHPHIRPIAVGKGLRTKINANLGTSPDFVDFGQELEKLEIAIKYGTDAVMDLSTGGDIRDLRLKMLEKTTVPLGTVPIYEAVCNLAKNKKYLEEMTGDELFDVIQDHIETGVDFITVHCGLTLRALPIMEKQKRLTGIVSRGGSFLYRWMKHNEKENPLYEQYDRLLDMAKEYNVTLSLGDGLRPGSIADSTDRTQVEELLILGELVQRAREKGVQAMVEGPGHIPIHEVQANVLLEKKLCNEAPFYVLGPLVIDCAPGYDHIVSAIGGAVAGAAGADFLCYVTPSEHLTLPDSGDVREGVIASRIAAHAADLAKGVLKAEKLDENISRARKAFDWDKVISLSLDPERAKEKKGRIGKDYKKCGMCGEYCAMRETT